MKTEIDIIGTLAIFLLVRTGSVFGKWEGRMTAKEQRHLFGCKPFGKLCVSINGCRETVSSYRKVCFGTDFESQSLTWSEFEREIHAGHNPFTLGRLNNKLSK